MGHSRGRKHHFLSGFDSATPLPAHRHRYGLAQVPTLGLGSVKQPSLVLRPFVEWPFCLLSNPYPTPNFILEIHNYFSDLIRVNGTGVSIN